MKLSSRSFNLFLRYGFYFAASYIYEQCDGKFAKTHIHSPRLDFQEANKERLKCKKPVNTVFMGFSYLLVIDNSGAGEDRTPVQTYSPKAFYMLISLLFVGPAQEKNKPMQSLAG